MASNRPNGTHPAQVGTAHNTETKTTRINMPVSPLCRFTDAVTGSGLSGCYINRPPNPARAAGFDLVLTSGEVVSLP